MIFNHNLGRADPETEVSTTIREEVSTEGGLTPITGVAKGNDSQKMDFGGFIPLLFYHLLLYLLMEFYNCFKNFTFINFANSDYTFEPPIPWFYLLSLFPF